MSEAAAKTPNPSELARDLRRSISTFVRSIRQGTGTVKTARSETLDLLDRLGSMNVAALAERRSVTHQTMRLIVAQLDADGAVAQTPDPADRRSRLVSITRAGRDALQHDKDLRASRIEETIRTMLSNDERETLKSAVLILDRLSGPLD